MAERLAEKPAKEQVEVGIVDTDIHNVLPSFGYLKNYLPTRWRRHMDMIEPRGTHGTIESHSAKYPKVAPALSRGDAWPPSGALPGSDLEFMRVQHLDGLNIEYGILNCLADQVQGEFNEQYAVAMARAINDWQIAEWLEKEPRLRASIVVPFRYPELAAAEIDRVGEHPGFVQVLIGNRTMEPLGRSKYWKMYEAAERHGLTIGMHASSPTGVPPTPLGWPSYYLEEHVVISQAAQAQIISLVCEGVFEKFPELRVVTIENGFAWLPPLMWRLDQHWKRLKEEVPHLKRPPSEYIREHVWVTTQPIEEPADPDHLLQAIEHFGADDKILFATDYPHWDYDDPNRAFPARMPKELKRKILSENAKKLYNFDGGSG